jgi:hypothetical protein
MSAVIIQIHQTKPGKAQGVFAAVNIAARRMGYSDTLALRAAQRARDAYESGGRSAGWVIAQAHAKLRNDAPAVCA